MPKKCEPHSLERKKLSGFALVISLALMSFILLLLISLTTLVKVEVQSSEIGKQQLKARLNAMLSMQIALGELQKTMGPDQRISATAEILNSSDASRRNTVGVWSSADVTLGDPSAATLAKGELVSWLASDAKDADGVLRNDYNEDPTSAVSEPVVLVGSGSLDFDGDGVADDLNDEIIVDLSETVISDGNRTSGRYAWWIGDEGVKARVNLSRAEAPTMTAKQRAVLEAGGNSVSNPGGLQGLTNVNFENEGSRILDLEFLDLLPSSTPQVSQKYFHDLSAHSAGVLADVRNGGLKKDLSLAFEMEDADFNSSSFGSGGDKTINAPGFGAVQPIFWVNTSVGDAHGPVWHLLRDYYQLYHKMEKPMSDPTIDARVFGPNVNHETLDVGNLWSTTADPLDTQPAVIMTGGAVKTNRRDNKGSSPGPIENFPGKSVEKKHPNPNIAAFEFGLDTNQFSIWFDTEGDPSRGGGQTGGAVTMPVMMTANYMPYLLRYVGETGIYFKDRPAIPGGDASRKYHEKAVHSVYRERFILHNPYNVTVRHTDIGLDSFGVECGVYFKYSDEDARFGIEDGDNDKIAQIAPDRISRQARVENGTFGPGEIKTFMGNNHDLDSGVDYASDTFEPEWHEYSLDNLETTQVYYPTHPTKPNAELLLLLRGRKPHKTLMNSETAVGWNSTDNYTLTNMFFATHLKQTGNSDPAGDFIRDRWPLASIMDTALLFPGIGTSPRTSSNVARMNLPEFETIAPLTMDTHSTIQGAKPVMTIDMSVVPMDNPDYRYPAFLRSNPLAPVRDSKNLLPPDDLLENTVGFPNLSPDISVKLVDNPSGLTEDKVYKEWGPNDGSPFDAGVSNPVMLELPTSPVLSLGKLQHANLSVFAHMPALAIGNSFAPMYVDPTTTYTVFQNYYLRNRVFYDLSYHLNEALWDGYFFSSYSIPYDSASDDYNETGDNVSDTFDTAFVSRDGTLPNPRMQLVLNKVLNDTETAADARSKLFTSDDAIKADAYEHAAENLLVRGAFNINSTSIEAWQAVLSGARDQAVYQSGSSSATQPTSERTPFSRFTQPAEGEMDDDLDSDSTWAGFRSLTDAQIESLATSIVAEIKLRTSARGWPNLSLADFVNRELVAGATGRGGIIQAAIEKSGLNASLNDANTAITEASMNDTARGPFPYAKNILDANGDSGNLASIAPTYLTQADVLQAIGSFISARSDTFRIRSYGETLDPTTQKVVAKVWLETIVQRIPEPVDPDVNDPSLGTYWDAFDSAGHPEPRRFVVLSIRELSEDEI